MTTPTPGTPLRLAPDVVRTPLPYGGTILVNAASLQLCEFGEQTASIMDRLLALGFPPPEAGPGVTRFAGQLVDAGWFVKESR
jgi:hypothetical protein